jgi:hypothetical protein
MLHFPEGGAGEPAEEEPNVFLCIRGQYEQLSGDAPPTPPDDSADDSAARCTPHEAGPGSSALTVAGGVVPGVGAGAAEAAAVLAGTARWAAGGGANAVLPNLASGGSKRAKVLYL